MQSELKTTGNAVICPTVGSILLAVREKMMLSQNDVQDLGGPHRNMISAAENAPAEYKIHPATFRKLLPVLGLTRVQFDQLVDWVYRKREDVPKISIEAAVRAWFVHEPPSPSVTPVQRWEYHMAYGGDGKVDKTFKGWLNEKGSEGWELVETKVVTKEDGKTTILARFKRPVRGDS